MRGQIRPLGIFGFLIAASAFGCGSSDRETPTAMGADAGDDGDDGDDGDGDGCETAGNDLIYVVDNTYRLLQFDPNAVGGAVDPFTLIGDLDCPAGISWDGGTATPFSMSVARDGFAWVLYNSGEIFKVS